MNNAMTLEDAGLGLREGSLESVLAFVGARSKTVRDLSQPAGDVFKGVGAVINQLLRTVIESRTSTEFEGAHSVAFHKYAALTLSLSRIAREVVPSDVVDRLTRESICELEADFREKALAAFGATARDQAMFTIWTLRKINDIISQISSAKLDRSKATDDREFCSHFVIYALRAHFSLDCLNMALQLGRPIYPEVMPQLIDGLRCMVNAYAWARRGLELYVPPQNPLLEPAVVEDEEDELWVRASMLDMAKTVDDDATTHAA